MKKVLFIDRDGTLVVEPTPDFQVDSLEKLIFYPCVFQGLSKIASELDYELVMITNQDGLGTNAFPEKNFWSAQNKIIEALKNEKIVFAEILIDKTFPQDNAPTRKPGTGLLQKYIFGNYDLANSFVIGDRETDIQLAENLNCQSIFIGDNHKNATFATTDWNAIYQFLKAKPRISQLTRTTNETDIKIYLNLDGTGDHKLSTGIGFFDHMLQQIAKHGNIDLNVQVKGDLQVDEHHTIEDVAIALGTAFNNALEDKKSIERYGFLLPMDDSLAQVAVDFGGRSELVWRATFKRQTVGKMPTEMFHHFFKSFTDAARCNLNIKAAGTNEHHKIEAIFKAFARAIKMAVKKTENYTIPSTKGTL